MEKAARPGPRRWATRRRRIAAAAAAVGGALAVWLAWLGWPVPGRVSERLTALNSAESGGWERAGPDLRTLAVRVIGDSGLIVDLRVLRPIDSGETPLPVMMLLGGHRTGQDAVDVVGHPGRLIVVALNYPYDGPDRVRGVRQIASALPKIRHALLDTPAAVSLALDWVLTQPWVLGGSVELAGVSLGSQFAAAAGVLDPRFSRIWFVQGAGDSRQWLVHQLRRRVESASIRHVAGSFLWWLAHGASLEPQRWVAQIAPRPVIIVGSRDDASLPPEWVTAFHEAAGTPKRLEWTAGAHINPRQPETVRPLLDLILAELQHDPDTS